MSSNNSLTSEEVIKRFKKIHGNRYGYSLVDFKGTKIPVTIICPIHGEFNQRPEIHFRGSGCNKCGIEKAKLKQTSNTELFIKSTEKIHNYKYDYSEVAYVNNSTSVIIKCKIHGKFKQKPSDHLTGKGCAKCGDISSAEAKRSNTTDFITKARKIHSNTYMYEKVEYNSAKEKITITCKTHGDFKQAPNNHLDGQGCPKCGHSKSPGFYSDLPTTLYYFKIKNVWKIGITTRDIHKRYPVDKHLIEDLITWEFPTGKEAFEYEQNIIKLNQKYAYYGSTPFTDGTGITECFNTDIYKLHTENQDE